MFGRRDMLLIIESERSDLCSFWVFVAADLIGALLLRSMGESLESAHIQHLSLLGLTSEQIPTSDDKAKSQGEMGPMDQNLENGREWK
jgi:hypothetical protein